MQKKITQKIKDSHCCKTFTIRDAWFLTHLFFRFEWVNIPSITDLCFPSPDPPAGQQFLTDWLVDIYKGGFQQLVGKLGCVWEQRWSAMLHTSIKHHRHPQTTWPPLFLKPSFLATSYMDMIQSEEMTGSSHCKLRSWRFPMKSTAHQQWWSCCGTILKH